MACSVQYHWMWLIFHYLFLAAETKGNVSISQNGVVVLHRKVNTGINTASRITSPYEMRLWTLLLCKCLSHHFDVVKRAGSDVVEIVKKNTFAH